MNNQGAGNAPNPPNNFANFNAMAAANPVAQLNFGNAGQGQGQMQAQFNNLGLANMPGGPALGPQPAVGAVNLADMNDGQLINALFNTPYAAAAAAPIQERVLPDDFQNMVHLLDEIAPGTLMVDFQGEFGFGHVFKLSTFLALATIAGGLRRNPATNVVVQPGQVVIYRVAEPAVEQAQVNNNNNNNNNYNSNNNGNAKMAGAGKKRRRRMTKRRRSHRRRSHRRR